MTASSPTPTAPLTQLQNTLTALSSFQLPPHYAEPVNDATSTNNDANNNEPSFPNPRLLTRYTTARDTYIHRRTLQLFIEIMSKYSQDMTLPSVSEEDVASQKRKREEILEGIKDTMLKVGRLREENVKAFNEFVERRRELVDIVDKMRAVDQSNQDEADKNNTASAADNVNGDEMEVSEQDLELQQHHLEELTERREMLQRKLAMVRDQITHVQGEAENTQRAVNEVRVKSGMRPLVWHHEEGHENNSEDGKEAHNKEADGAEKEAEAEYINVKSSVQAELTALRQLTSEYKSSFDSYSYMRELTEEIGGIAILDSKAEGCGISLRLMLLGRHVLELDMENKDEGMSVRDAKLVTETTFCIPLEEGDTANLMDTMDVSNEPSFSRIISQKPCEEVSIPPLDDLVSYAEQLESSKAIRFVISETLARIRTVTARVEELSSLKSKYAAQIYNVGNEQEVVCALNEGISVALRLGADCPLVKGSVYISEMCGVGGWEEDKLEELKRAVVEARCCGPVEVMEVLVQEIGRKRDEGWVLPLTPVLLRKGGV